MFSGWALSFEPRMRPWAPEAVGDAVRLPAFFCACVEAVADLPLGWLSASCRRAVVASSAFAEARYSDAPPSTSSSAVTTNSGGRINELMGSPGCPTAVYGAAASPRVADG